MHREYPPYIVTTEVPAFLNAIQEGVREGVYNSFIVFEDVNKKIEVLTTENTKVLGFPDLKTAQLGQLFHKPNLLNWFDSFPKTVADYVRGNSCLGYLYQFRSKTILSINRKQREIITDAYPIRLKSNEGIKNIILLGVKSILPYSDESITLKATILGIKKDTHSSSLSVLDILRSTKFVELLKESDEFKTLFLIHSMNHTTFPFKGFKKYEPIGLALLEGIKLKKAWEELRPLFNEDDKKKYDHNFLTKFRNFYDVSQEYTSLTICKKMEQDGYFNRRILDL